MKVNNMLQERPHALLTSVSSDSHTWNLVYLQLLLEEFGFQVTNLGACTPDALIVDESTSANPDLIVMSSVNGHGYTDGVRVIRLLRNCPELAATPIVIGGKLGIRGAADTAALRAAGFDAVFQDGAASESFPSFIRSLRAKAV
jgi:methylaspartate mutase sigma subunit